MNSEIAQIIALACYGNAALRGEKIPVFFPSNSTCRSCDRIKFVEISPSFHGHREQLVADTPDQWFQDLIAQGAKGIRLSHSLQNEASMPERMLAGFAGGGGTWTMEVHFPSSTAALWVARWDVWNQDAPDDKIWRVKYSRISEGNASPASEPDLSKVSARLFAILKEIRAFSAEHHCDGFTQCFDQAIESLTTSKRVGHHQDWAPDNSIPLVAMAVLDACESAWVFGAMGSWNDMSFEGGDQAEYERVSERFFEVLTESIASATTSSFRADGALLRSDLTRARNLSKVSSNIDEERENSSPSAVYVVPLVFGLSLATYIYLFKFDELSEERLVTLSPFWFLTIVFGLVGILAEKASNMVKAGKAEDLDQGMAKAARASRILILILCELPSLIFNPTRRSDNPMAFAIIVTGFWAALLYVFLLQIFPGL